MLRCSAWAVVWRTATGWGRQTGLVPGRQTVGRAELCAAIWAYRCDPSPPALFIDNQYVVNGICAVIRGGASKYLDGPDSDLWELMVQAAPKVEPTWIPSHKSREEAVARGYATEDWEGNQQADKWATVATVHVRPSPEVVGKRRRALRDLRLAQRVIATVQEEVLQRAHADRAAQRRTGAKKRTFRMIRFSRLRFRPNVRIKRKRPPRELAGPATFPGIRDLRPAAGAPPAELLGQKGSVAWLVACANCNAHRTQTGCWTGPAKTLCSDAGEIVRLATGVHDLVAKGEGFRCRRCDRTLPSVQRAKAARTTCPVPVRLDASDTVVEPAIPALQAAILCSQKWRGAHLGVGRIRPKPEAAVEEVLLPFV